MTAQIMARRERVFRGDNALRECETREIYYTNMIHQQTTDTPAAAAAWPELRTRTW